MIQIMIELYYSCKKHIFLKYIRGIKYDIIDLSNNIKKETCLQSKKFSEEHEQTDSQGRTDKLICRGRLAHNWKGER